MTQQGQRRKRWGADQTKAPRSPDWETTSGRFPTRELRNQWFINHFLNADLGTLVPEETRSDLSIFVANTTAPIIEPAEDLGADRLPTPSTVQELQEQFRECLAAMRAGKRWTLERPPKYAIRASARGLERGDYQGTFSDLFLVAMTDTLQDCWTSLLECPRCRNAFLKKGKQKYCSPKCSQGDRWDRFKGERTARDYRAERERAAKKRHYSRVKLGRKTRRR